MGLLGRRHVTMSHDPGKTNCRKVDKVLRGWDDTMSYYILSHKPCCLHTHLYVQPPPRPSFFNGIWGAANFAINYHISGTVWQV